MNQCMSESVRYKYLVSAEGMREHVATTCPQHVHFLTHIIIQLIKVHLCSPHLCLHLYTDRQTDTYSMCFKLYSETVFDTRWGCERVGSPFSGIKIKSTISSKCNYTTFILLRNS